MSPPLRPILLNGCARAATAAEARFRIDRPIAGRAARVVALDDGAADVVRRVAERPWHDARFLVSDGRGGGADEDIPLRVIDGPGSTLSAELDAADVAIVVATSDRGAPAASAIARECDRRGIMTAALILGGRIEAGAAVTALRPWAPVLLVTNDEEDVSEVLTALRA